MTPKPPPKLSPQLPFGAKPVPELLLELEQDICRAFGSAKDAEARLEGIASNLGDARTAASLARNCRQVLEEVVQLAAKARREAIRAGV